MRKVLCVLLAAVMFFTCTGALAAGQDSLMARENWLSQDQYYYQQLSMLHQRAWEVDITNALSYPQQKAAFSKNNRHKALACMIKHDNPRIFWIDWIDTTGVLRYETGSVVHNKNFALPAGQTMTSLQQTFLDAIPAAVKQIRSTLAKNAGERDILKAIHDWLCKNNSYNYNQTSKHKQEHDPVSFDFLAAHSAYSAMIPGDKYQPVCEGYASAFKILCEEFGIECICISGSTSFASSHMWNYVRLSDGKWYLVDVTSDDVETKKTPYYHTYFLIGSQKSAQQSYKPDEYLGAGVKPANGYTEGAAFTFPTLSK